LFPRGRSYFFFGAARQYVFIAQDKEQKVIMINHYLRKISTGKLVALVARGVGSYDLIVSVCVFFASGALTTDEMVAKQQELTTKVGSSMVHDVHNGHLSCLVVLGKALKCRWCTGALQYSKSDKAAQVELFTKMEIVLQQTTLENIQLRVGCVGCFPNRPVCWF
jgi:hypothetical protein